MDWGGVGLQKDLWTADLRARFALLIRRKLLLAIVDSSAPIQRVWTNSE